MSNCKDCGKKTFNKRAIRCRTCNDKYCVDEKNPNWKGDKIGYHGLHKWIESKLGKPRKCWYCGTTKAKMFHWANKSGQYKRRINDWERLCVSCHCKKDDIHNKMWITIKTRRN